MIHSSLLLAQQSACDEYSTLIHLVRHELQVHLPHLIQKAHRKIQCVPVFQLDRAARSKDSTTHLHQPRWNSFWIYQKIRLALHESFVLDGFEGDGNYWQTTQTLPVLLQKSKDLSSRLKSTRFYQTGNRIHLFHPHEPTAEGGFRPFQFTSSDEKNVTEQAHEFCQSLGFLRMVRLDPQLPMILCELKLESEFPQ